MSIVISIEDLWKEYRLGIIGHGTLTHDLQSLWAKIRSKEDPNSQITPVSKRKQNQERGKRFWALRNVCLEVKEGEVLGIIGKNGAGKSTLLKILSRVTAPTLGKIKIKGRIASLLEVGTGFHPELTGKENVFMNGTILGMSRTEINNRLEEIIEFSGVGKFVDTPVKRYSSGMHVRLAFSVAAHLEPEILLVDEVLAVGDVEFQQKCIGKMKDVASEGRTVLFVSHNMSAINRLCDSCICLESGIISKTGNPSDVIANYYNQSIKSLNAEKFWDLQEKNPGYGTGVNILSAKICQPHNCIISKIKINQPVEITIELDVAEATPEFAIHVKVKRSDGLVLIHSNDMIPDNNFGKIITTLTLPKYAMNIGDYYIDIAADIPNKSILFMEDLCLKFSVISNSNRMSIYTTGNNKGVIGPFIGDWSRS